jgi:Phage integrase family
VAQVIDLASNLMHRTMMMMPYAMGLRRAEMCHLKVTDIDSDRMVIHVRQGKLLNARVSTNHPSRLCEPAHNVELRSNSDTSPHDAPPKIQNKPVLILATEFRGSRNVAPRTCNSSLASGNY